MFDKEVAKLINYSEEKTKRTVPYSDGLDFQRSKWFICLFYFQ